jgi:hypothetical protein
MKWRRSPGKLVKFKSGIRGFPGHSNPPPPPTHAQYMASPHYRKMRIKYDNDICMELIDLIENLDN